MDRTKTDKRLLLQGSPTGFCISSEIRLLSGRDSKLWGKVRWSQFLSYDSGDCGALRKLSTSDQSLFDAGYVAGVALADKDLEAGIVGELEFDSVTAMAGARLRWAYQVHLTDT